MFPRDPQSPDAILASFDADSIRRFPRDPNAPTFEPLAPSDDPTWHFAMAAERRSRPLRKGDDVRVDFPRASRPRFGKVEWTYEDGQTFGIRYAEGQHVNVIPSAYVSRIGS